MCLEFPNALMRSKSSMGVAFWSSFNAVKTALCARVFRAVSMKNLSRVVLHLVSQLSIITNLKTSSLYNFQGFTQNKFEVFTI